MANNAQDFSSRSLQADDLTVGSAVTLAAAASST
jgi:hypothetical protein